jgi:putative endonuclease
MAFTVYILHTSKNTLYTGQTNNLAKRLLEHKSKTVKSAKYMRCFDSFKLVYSETFPTRQLAMKREYELKHLSRPQKDKLINTPHR